MQILKEHTLDHSTHKVKNGIVSFDPRGSCCQVFGPMWVTPTVKGHCSAEHVPMATQETQASIEDTHV